jgi:saccharopine dehydrogenase-like NADP-dependent oxidoreductase
MKVTIEGESQSHVWELYDETDPKTRTSSMARTTGYTCCAMVEAVLSGMWDMRGVFPGELIGHDESVFNHVISFLEERGVRLVKC